MFRKPIPHFLILLLTLLLTTSTAAADREGWNEPPSEAGYENRALLKINPDYFDVAAATGGDFYFWGPGEFAASAGLLSVPVGSDPVSLAYGSGSEEFALAMEVPIDATISRLTLFTGAQRLDELRLLRPDGRSIEENPAGVDLQVYRHMRIVTVDVPEPGLWQVDARGAGAYSIAARYLAERKRLRALELEAIDLIGFTFVEKKGLPGHEGFFPVEQPVRPGEQRLCRITLSGGVQEPSAEMISAAGGVLGEIWLEENGDDDDESIGTCRIPEHPFRVRVRGEDREGNPFQRITPGLTFPGEDH